MIEVDGTHVDVWRKYPYHGQERIIQFATDTLAYEKYTAPDRVRGHDAARHESPRHHRRGALRSGRARRPRRAAVRVRRRPARRRHGEAARRRGLRRAARAPLERRSPRTSSDLVVDLSDEPVLGPRERIRLASRVLAPGCPTSAPTSASTRPCSRRSRCRRSRSRAPASGSARRRSPGKLARLLAATRDVVVVSMGRGGPAEPEVRRVASDDRRAGRASPAPVTLAGHAASDYLEDAALAGVVTVGCRRAGGGLAGAVGLVERRPPAPRPRGEPRPPDLVVFEGLGRGAAARGHGPAPARCRRLAGAVAREPAT